MAKISLEDLYARVTGDEDARVCRDIPDEACADQPRNFFAYLLANLLNKVADEIGSARLIIPWMFGALGVPATFTGFLVPIREAGVLLPQLLVAAAVRRLPRRKYVWLFGALLSALCLFGMGWAALELDGSAAGIAVVAMLILFSLARGICSVSAKDVLGKTVSKSKRGALMGLSAGLAGVVVLLLGIWLGAVNLADAGIRVFAGLLIAGGILWLFAALAFAAIAEQPGATEGGGNALAVALGQLGILRRDADFRRFVIARGLLLATALAPPFYVLLAQQHSGGGYFVTRVGIPRRPLQPHGNGAGRGRRRRARPFYLGCQRAGLGLGARRNRLRRDIPAAERHARRRAPRAQGLPGGHGDRR